MMTIMDMNALKGKTAPASFVALMTAAQDHGEKEGYTFEWPKLTPTLGSSSLQPLLCSTLFIGLDTCTYKYLTVLKMGELSLLNTSQQIRLKGFKPVIFTPFLFVLDISRCKNKIENIYRTLLSLSLIHI